MLRPPSAGNYGFQDQQFALLWVKENIARFGGDPNNVTLFGDSSGAMSVCGHLVAPGSRGLFTRAMQESGTCSVLTMPLHDRDSAKVESALSLGRAFTHTIGCDAAPDVAACLRGKPVDQILNTEIRDIIDVNLSIAHYMPNIDHAVFPDAPWRLLRAGLVNSVDWVGGSNHEDGSIFALSNPLADEAAFDQKIEQAFPGHGAEVAALYPLASNGGSTFLAYSTFVTDAIFACPAREQARLLARIPWATPYLYEFSFQNAFGAATGLGAFHGGEAPYFFDNFPAPLVFNPDADGPVVAATQGYWVNFGQTGMGSS